MMYCSKVRREFKAVISYEEDVNTLMDDWPEWRRKIICLTSKEASTHPYLRKLVTKLENNDSFPNQDGMWLHINVYYIYS